MINKKYFTYAVLFFLCTMTFTVSIHAYNQKTQFLVEKQAWIDTHCTTIEHVRDGKTIATDYFCDNYAQCWE